MTTTIHTKKILILDFGSQYTQVIARRVRELGVYCEIHPYSISDEEIKKIAPIGVILSGGPETVTLTHTPRIPDIIFELDCPILGICYGMQAIAEQMGGKVAPGHKREFGYAKVNIIAKSILLDGIHDQVNDDIS